MENVQIKCPWDIDTTANKPLVDLPRYDWLYDYASRKGISSRYFKPPEERTDKIVRKIVECCFGSRNFVMNISNSASYMRVLYSYVGLTWALNTDKGFAVLDLKKQDFDVDYAATVDLLIVPFAILNNYEASLVRGSLRNVVDRRFATFKPLITDFYTEEIPEDIQDVVSYIQEMDHTFGDGGYDFFVSRRGKVLRIEKEIEKEEE